MPWTPVFAQRCALGESPFWHPCEQRLYWVDTPGCMVLRGDPHSGAVESWGMPSEPGCIAPARNGGLVIALRDGIYRAWTWAGALTQLVRFGHDSTTMRFNDGKCDALGRLWVGTLYEPRDAPKANLYCIDARGGAAPRVEVKAQHATTANGLAWSPDNRTIYWADTPAHVIHAWDFELESSAMRHHRTFQEFAPKPAGWQPGATGQPAYGGRPDGAAVDAEGHYYCAMFEGQRLCKFAPDGRLLDAIAVPARCPTMPCFGGADLRTLYLTTASQRRPEAELEEFPWSGQVLAMRVEVPGLPVHFFED
ncbi:SMP-30/gluconolactonase/LRE family protein [Ramlibacter sp. H39-3-26]|uniref:SMP-30/gluconolactonase/LRE family protein n=1 Tax=Curvibacter soli TaxID=3031331 RepID=UPI0023DC6D0B|nr:SMP-30/gluconolactonase/LRE family protein [Ramlibacter sp. H39-3-26]MDF1486050.1 SMP-30/gluconolactonase/LRE family protein [Ramlibacter sp. H39-3-26]